MSAGVSVVIPAFNYARFLPAAIDSVLRQTFSDFEILVVDDGSTDDTPQVVASFTGPRIRYIRQENAGLSAARNTGIRNARAPFVAFLDADDEWLPDFLATMLDAFETLGEDFAIVACGAERMDQAGRPRAPQKTALAG